MLSKLSCFRSDHSTSPQVVSGEKGSSRANRGVLGLAGGLGGQVDRLLQPAQDPPGHPPLDEQPGRGFGRQGPALRRQGFQWPFRHLPHRNSTAVPHEILLKYAYWIIPIPDFGMKLFSLVF